VCYLQVFKMSMERSASQSKLKSILSMEFNLLHLVNTEIKSNVFSKKIVFFQPEEEEKKLLFTKWPLLGGFHFRCFVSLSLVYDSCKLDLVVLRLKYCWSVLTMKLCCLCQL
jgi:hypothetical protein